MSDKKPDTKKPAEIDDQELDGVAGGRLAVKKPYSIEPEHSDK